jgi:hypothetical protein
VVALAVSTAKRAPALPDVPSVVEAGYPNAEYLFWGGIADPAKTRAPSSTGCTRPYSSIGVRNFAREIRCLMRMQF